MVVVVVIVVVVEVVVMVFCCALSGCREQGHNCVLRLNIVTPFSLASRFLLIMSWFLILL